jgi:flagellar hook-length control protein FliK
MGASAVALSAPGPVPAVTDPRAPAVEAGPEDTASSGPRFTDAMDSARGSADSGTDTSASQAVSGRVEPAARGRAARAAAPAPFAAPADTAPAGAVPNGAPPGAASSEPAVANGNAAPADADAVAELLPALVTGSLPKGAGTTSDGAASPPAATSGPAANGGQDGAAIGDPVGLLAMILGVAPAVSGASLGAGSSAGALVPSAMTPYGAPVSAASGPIALTTTPAPVPARSESAAGLTTLQPAGSGPSGTGLLAQLNALPDATASSPDGGSGPLAQGTVAPPVQALSDLVRSLAPAAASASNPQQNVAVPVGSAGWPAAVAAQVHWLAGSGVTSATLHLAPEHLGPVQVYIDLQSSQVNVSFSAAHAETRAALEQALPKLREMFATGGLALGQASVQQEARSGSEYASPARVTRVTETSAANAALPPGHALGLVDEYA